jgi:hypothetical protein
LAADAQPFLHVRRIRSAKKIFVAVVARSQWSAATRIAPCPIPTLMVRSAAKPRVSNHGPRSGPSFETLALLAPQDEAGSGHCGEKAAPCAELIIGPAGAGPVGLLRPARYLAQFNFRYNNRSALGVDDRTRAEALAKGIVGKRLTYRPPRFAKPSNKRRNVSPALVVSIPRNAR